MPLLVHDATNIGERLFDSRSINTMSTLSNSALNIVTPTIGASAAGITRIPAFVEPDMTGITFADKNVGLSRAFIVDGTNRELVTQLGRALAMFQTGDWKETSHATIRKTVDAMVVFQTSRDLIQTSTGRHIRALLSDYVFEGQPVKKASLMEWDSSISEWKNHKMVAGTCRLVMKNRIDDTEFVTAYTKYHYLALLLAGCPIRVVTGGFGGGEAKGYVLNGFHSQNMWTAKLNPVELPTVAEIAAAVVDTSTLAELENAHYDNLYAVMTDNA